MSQSEQDSDRPVFSEEGLREALNQVTTNIKEEVPSASGDSQSEQSDQ